MCDLLQINTNYSLRTKSVQCDRIHASLQNLIAKANT